ncbi:MAG TPA: leucine--tRNA ligase [Candidatus Polarisedimenticolia bacterium]|nr:leucine--tRNA ligase [Candidatus Polarisedimenticolia bacterium]
MTRDEYREAFDAIERKWQSRWDTDRAFEAPRIPTGDHFYCLEMLPYPSGRLHMGHVRNYSIGDAVARFQKMRGREVLHPMGWDSFGLPAENAAIKHGTPPAKWTNENIAAMGAQLKRLGLSYDWTREIAAHRPDYYRWNQWFFLKMFERGLAYRSRRWVNWCGSCQTVLANEQVENGRCWRCASVVGRTELDQWFLKITAYASELDAELDTMTGWPERVRVMQRNWIGKSEGAQVRFAIVDDASRATGADLEIFTTRLDTIFGATFCVVAPRHPVLAGIPAGAEARARLDAFLRRIDARDVTRSGMEPEEKEGIDTGLRVRNPYNGEILAVWTANFVLMEYGTGAIMAVPAHDERDFEFAHKYGLPVRTVVEAARPLPTTGGATIEDGVLVASGPYDGLDSAAARTAMLRDGEGKGFARPIVRYRLLDWGISRQRYWGTPIPIIYCERHGAVPVPESDLPVVLPEDIPLTGQGGSPLAQVKSFVETTCPVCGGPGRRETDTMDTFVDSSWYFFRYCDPRNARAPFDPGVVGAWVPIDLYVGGITHATLHLIYCRFFAKVLRDLGLVSFDEPVKNLLCQGMVLKGGTAMSKSKGNVVEPDDMVSRYGADTTRLFTLFAAPPEKDLEWNEKGVEGCFRFLERVWRLLIPRASDLARVPPPGEEDGAGDARHARLRRRVHQTIDRVTGDIERRLHLNTPVAALMELLNETQDFCRDASDADRPYLKEAGLTLALLLQPFAPHISEELWTSLGGQGSAVRQAWPTASPRWLQEEQVEIPVQVNGRLRARLLVAPSISETEALSRAQEDARVSAHLQGRAIRKTIYLPGKLLNIVVG